MSKKKSVTFSDANKIVAYPLICAHFNIMSDFDVMRIQDLKLNLSDVAMVPEIVQMIMESNKLSQIYLYDAVITDIELELIFSALWHRIEAKTDNMRIVNISAKAVKANKETCPSLAKVLANGEFRSISIYWTRISQERSRELYDICIENPRLRYVDFDNNDEHNEEARRFIYDRYVKLDQAKQHIEEANRKKTEETLSAVNKKIAIAARKLVQKRQMRNVKQIGKLKLKKNEKVDPDDILVRNNIQTFIDSYYKKPEIEEIVKTVRVSKNVVKVTRQSSITSYFKINTD